MNGLQEIRHEAAVAARFERLARRQNVLQIGTPRFPPLPIITFRVSFFLSLNILSGSNGQIKSAASGYDEKVFFSIITG